jgi:Zn-dependent protease
VLSVKGIPIRIHWTFALVFIWIGWISYREELGSSQIGWFSILILLLFVCVILHELGHAIAARYYNIPARDIYLLPIGGMVRLEYLPKAPLKEVVIALAGPLVNLLLALIFLLVYRLGGISGTWWGLSELTDLLNYSGMIKAMVLLNGTLFFFNLLPAYPMDGGRIVRATLSLKWGRRKATLIATYIAQLLAFAMMLAGMTWGAMMLTLICIFIFFSARWERRGLLYEAEDEEE